ncbi:hypothetical protein COO60DRAFT_1490518 [Scenedesmus sp. NREL 46B-D3]|nr:hypothetical protein COO60DRAFT_1490518 [Scenedesmus sp. NREL 46B-D3]
MMRACHSQQAGNMQWCTYPTHATHTGNPGQRETGQQWCMYITTPATAGHTPLPKVPRLWHVCQCDSIQTDRHDSACSNTSEPQTSNHLILHMRSLTGLRKPTKPTTHSHLLRVVTSTRQEQHHVPVPHAAHGMHSLHRTIPVMRGQQHSAGANCAPLHDHTGHHHEPAQATTYL